MLIMMICVGLQYKPGKKQHLILKLSNPFVEKNMLSANINYNWYYMLYCVKRIVYCDLALSIENLTGTAGVLAKHRLYSDFLYSD